MRQLFNKISMPYMIPFSKWFKGSKIVTSDGAPLVVFHATKHDFSLRRFRPFSHFGSAKSAESLFLDRQKISEDISKSLALSKADDSFRTYPVYLNIKNPLKIGDFGVDDRDGILRELNVLIEQGQEDVIPCRNFVRDFKESQTLIFRLPMIDEIDKDAYARKALLNGIIKHLKRAGYDGIQYENRVEDNRSQSYINFNRSQVRSAIDANKTGLAHGKYISHSNIIRSRLEL